MAELYKVVRIDRVFCVVLAETVINGVRLATGTHAECLARAERLANTSARKSSGGKKGHHTVKRDGDRFAVVKVG